MTDILGWCTTHFLIRTKADKEKTKQLRNKYRYVKWIFCQMQQTQMSDFVCRRIHQAFLGQKLNGAKSYQYGNCLNPPPKKKRLCFIIWFAMTQQLSGWHLSEKKTKKYWLQMHGSNLYFSNKYVLFISSITHKRNILFIVFITNAVNVVQLWHKPSGRWWFRQLIWHRKIPNSRPSNSMPLNKISEKKNELRHTKKS